MSICSIRAVRRACLIPGRRASRRRLALPEIYHQQIAGTGIVGAIVVEASPGSKTISGSWSAPIPIRCSWAWWAASIPPSRISREYLNRFSKDPLWRGIRYARVWQMENGKQVLKPGMAEGLKLLAQAGQTLDMANPSFDLLRGALLATDAVPDLRLVMDHMPSLDPTPETQALYDALIAELAQRPNFSMKLSQVIHKDANGNNDHSLPHRARLDRLMAVFGEDRVMFGGDWPNSVGTATIPEAVALMQRIFRGQAPYTGGEIFLAQQPAHLPLEEARRRTSRGLSLICCYCEVTALRPGLLRLARKPARIEPNQVQLLGRGR